MEFEVDPFATETVQYVANVLFSEALDGFARYSNRVDVCYEIETDDMPFIKRVISVEAEKRGIRVRWVECVSKLKFILETS